MLAIVAALIIGCAVFYMLYTTQRAAENSAVEDRLGLDLSAGQKKVTLPIYLSLTRPLLKGAYLDLAAGFWKPHQLEAWKTKIISAGLGKYIDPQHLVASKFWFAFMLAVPLLLIKAFAAEGPSIVMIAGLVAVAFFFPNLHLNSLRAERQQQIRMAMPYVVDLLTLSIEAGLDFVGAIGKVVDRSKESPLIEELSMALKDIQLGKTRAQALRSMAERIDMQEMSSFVAVLISSDQMGASIGTVLRAQSDTMRTERLNKAEKLGAQASQKILIPLIMFILPAVLLVIFGPIVLQMFGVRV